MGLPGRERSLTISSAVWIQSTNVADGQTDGQTNGRTDTGRQQRPRLLTHSVRGKKSRSFKRALNIAKDAADTMFAGSAFHVFTTRYQKVLAIKAEGHNGLQSLHRCPHETENSQPLQLPRVHGM